MEGRREEPKGCLVFVELGLDAAAEVALRLENGEGEGVGVGGFGGSKDGRKDTRSADTVAERERKLASTPCFVLIWPSGDFLVADAPAETVVLRKRWLIGEITGSEGRRSSTTRLTRATYISSATTLGRRESAVII